MDKKQLFDDMAELITVLQESRKDLQGRMNFGTIDRKLKIKSVYKAINPKLRLDLACPTCVRSYLHIIESYYGREFPKWLKENNTTLGEITDQDVASAHVKIDHENKQKEVEKWVMDIEAEERAKPKQTRAEILAQARAVHQAKKKNRLNSGDASTNKIKDTE